MASRALFQGSAVALVTPFKDGKVDVPAIARLVEFQVENGTAAIVACGTTGEPATMTAEERELVVREVIRAAKGRVPVIAGTGTNSTQAVIDTANRYQDMGCAAQLVVTPYYNKTTQEGLYRHFMEVADHTQLPIVIYNVPSRTTLDISPEILGRLADCEKMIAVKESSYNVPYVMEKMRRAGGRLVFYSGNDDMTVPLMALGAEGVVSVAANVIPKEMAEMAGSHLAGDNATALDLQFRMLPLFEALFGEVSPIPCKAAMAMMGLCGSDVRLPLVNISPPAEARLREALIGVGVDLKQ